MNQNDSEIEQKTTWSFDRASTLMRGSFEPFLKSVAAQFILN
jgi:hypothetical protein